MDASVNTLYNSAQDIVVDGMARERQQYSGDAHINWIRFTRLSEKQGYRPVYNHFQPGNYSK